MVIDPSHITAIAIALAFAAGLVSFLSPCVLPLVPAYVGYLGAMALRSSPSAATPGGNATVATRRATFTLAIFFVLGFSLVFIALGATVGLVGFAFQDMLSGLLRAGAALLLVFGLRVAQVRLSLSRWLLVALVAALAMFVIDVRPIVPRVLDSLMVFVIVLAGAEMPTAYRLPLAVTAGVLNVFSSPTGQMIIAGRPVEPIQVLALLIETVLIVMIVLFLSTSDLFYSEKRFHMQATGGRSGVGGAMLMGAIFAAGWTPCVGPNLAAILALGSESQTVGLSALLLAFYSAGLAVPFLLVAFAFNHVSGMLQAMKRHMSTITLVNGILLMFMGILLLSGRLASLAQIGSFFNINL
ncbi:MAG: cytochrome c biogenesis protein CcdA [Anaerolineae bacterium]